MNNRLKKSLDGRNENYILPFLWMHGEEEAVLRNEVQKIHESSIGALCVEARPHPDYCGEKWWFDLGVVIDEAKKYGMKVWILDDAHFPTGYANGILAKKYPQHTKKYLKVFCSDAAGPMSGVSLPINEQINAPIMPNPMAAMFGRGLLEPEIINDDYILGVFAGRTGKNGDIDEIINITDKLEDGVLYWDIPNGYWRIVTVVVTRKGDGRKSYLNWLDEESAQCQIEAVYEPHLEKFGHEFGKTIAGFFSDEPEIGNTTGYNFDEDIGKKTMTLPFSNELSVIMEKDLGDEWVNLVPALWYNFEDKSVSANIRKVYMDGITKLIEKNFSKKLGDWCSNHGVEYIGHVIEDNNQHARLGCGMGHFFRSLRGQHMSGIDDIGNQVVFGGERTKRNGMTKGDGEFYHYALGKLGSSLGHIDPIKSGRTMCEIFGAYGWDEGTRLMKWLADHFMVRGVNYFVPHAFSPKDFPDADCPPHFYGRGKNPMYRPFKYLMEYMNRVCHLTNGGVHKACGAILYNGESQWMGDLMYVQKPARALMENQIDFDIIPYDVFEGEYPAEIKEEKLIVNNEEYGFLVVPYCEYMPVQVARFISSHKELKIYIINSMPKAVVGGNEEENNDLLKSLNHIQLVSLEELANTIKGDKLHHISLSNEFPMLRYYRYINNSEFYVLNNESTGDIFSGEITVPSNKIPIMYNPYENKVYNLPYKINENSCSFEITIKPYELFIVFMEDEIPSKAHEILKFSPKDQVDTDFVVSYASAELYPKFSEAENMSELVNISKIKPDFSGTIKYETTFLSQNGDEIAIELPEAYEFVELWINDVKIGSKIAPPYIFVFGDSIKKGENRLVIEVTNTLGHQIKEGASPFMPMRITEPSGLLKKPVLLT